MEEEGVWGWIVAALGAAGTAAGLWWNIREKRIKLRALEARQEAEQEAEQAKQKADQKTGEARQNQREADYAIRKYQQFIELMEERYKAVEVRVNSLQQSETRCREELAGVKADNLHLHEQIKQLQMRIASLEGAQE